MTLQSKAWVLDTSILSEPWYAPGNVYYSETRGKAKQEALSEVYNMGLTDKEFNEFSFLTIKIKRAKRADKYLVDGKVKTAESIEYDKKVAAKNKEIDDQVSKHPNAFAYIKKGGYYYCSNYCGYTERIDQAGIYPIKDAAIAVKGCSLSDNMRLIVINADEHNAMIQKKINELTAKLITP